jgi:hypothetical protein
MSIDARISKVYIKEDGSGYLKFIDRPKSNSAYDGIAGQSQLHFDSSPENVKNLEGKDIWGGSSEIMLGEKKIAERIGYTRIKFIVDKL